MLNKKLVKIAKITGVTVLVIVTFVTGYFLGDGVRKNQADRLIAEKTQELTKNDIDEGSIITKERVQEFLIAYYTKKDLSENRERYKPLVTKSLYDLMVKEEKKPANMAYKGYIVDWNFEAADIYINQTRGEVLATVKYNNKKLLDKEDKSKAQVTTHNVTLKLKFMSVNGQMVVSEMQNMTLKAEAEKVE